VRNALLLACVVLSAGCSSLIPRNLPEKLPPLADMEEPLALTQEPKDEDARAKLPLGGFTGVAVSDVRRTLDELEGDAAGVRVAHVVENSPGDAAGVEEGDVVVEVTTPGGERRALSYPSQWREVELAAQPGTELKVVIDRAGVQKTVAVGVVARVRVPERDAVVRLREEEKVGIVLRSATEVEARAAGLGPGGGAVVVGLSGGSPWRAAGLRFGDLIVAIDGKEVAHPQAVLDAIRAAETDAKLSVDFVRDGTRQTIEASVSRRAKEVQHINIPLLFSYDADRGDTEWSAIIGLLNYHSTIAAWQVRLLWFVKFGGGDADKLVEVDK
jgi:C-terminal processing protease CtpA/Prc